MYYLRNTPQRTVADVIAEVDDHRQTVQVIARDVRIDLEADQPFIALSEQIEIPATSESVAALASWLDVPTKFVERVQPDLRQHILSTMLERTPQVASWIYNDHGLKEVRDPGQRVIEPRQLADLLGRVMTPEAPVIEMINTTSDFRLDVSVPEGFDRGVGGDIAVGDLAAGGVSIIQNRRQNLVPSVSPFIYRYICTNGMVTIDPGLRVDARGQSVEEVLMELELAAQRAFSRVEQDIQAFYDLRNTPVEHPEQSILAMAQEHGIPDRTRLALVERIPAFEDGITNMFDVVNLVTNQANEPTIRNRAGVRRRLEEVGGEIVTEHVARCATCQHRLN